MLTIKKIIANEIIDSRGYPTRGTAVGNDRTVRTSVPSGTSVGSTKHTSCVKDEKRFGMGVTKAVSIINERCAKISGVS